MSARQSLTAADAARLRAGSGGMVEATQNVKVTADVITSLLSENNLGGSAVGASLMASQVEGSLVQVRSGITTAIMVQEKGSRSFLLENGGQGSELESAHVASWQSTSCLVIAEVVGSGVLALGGNFSKVGMGFALGSLIACLPVNTYTSLLLGEVYKAVPEVVTYGDALARLIHPRAGTVGYWSLYVFFFFTATNYVICLSDSIQSVAYALDWCRPLAAGVGCVLLIPTNQYRSLGALGFLSFVSFATIVATLIICVYMLLTTEADKVCTGEYAAPDFYGYSSAISGFVFAYAGQSMMLELQSEMKDPRDFPKSVLSSFFTLFVVYMVVGIVSHARCGAASPGDLQLVVAKGPWKVVVGVLMTIHLTISYTLYQQVLCRAICIKVLPGALGKGPGARVQWFALTTLLLACCYLCANLVPLFIDLVNLIGAFFCTVLSCVFPPMLVLALRRQDRDNRKRWVHWVSDGTAAAVFVLGIYLLISCTLSCLVVLGQDASKSGNGPFGCHSLFQEGS